MRQPTHRTVLAQGRIRRPGARRGNGHSGRKTLPQGTARSPGSRRADGSPSRNRHGDATRRRPASQRRSDPARNAGSACGAHSHVSRHPAAVRELAVPRPVRAAGRVRSPDELARAERVRGRHARPRLRRLARRRGPAGPSDRALVRRRLPQPLHERAPDPARARLARRAQPRPLEPRPVVGHPAGDGSRARRGGLGARCPLAYAPRPYRPERIVAAPRGGRLTRGDPRAVRRRRQLLLLPGRSLRLSGHRGRSRRRATSGPPPRSSGSPEERSPSRLPASGSTAGTAPADWRGSSNCSAERRPCGPGPNPRG